jgi:hypothetical protein
MKVFIVYMNAAINQLIFFTADLGGTEILKD